MDYLLSNTKVLSKHFPQVAALLEASTVDGGIYRNITARDGSPNVEIHKNERVVALHSLYDPDREAAGWLKSTEGRLEKSSHVLVVGLGLGYHLQHLLEKYPTKKYYIYEPDIQLLHLALKLRDLTGILNHPSVITLAVGEEDHVLIQLLQSISSLVTDKFEEVTIPIYKQLYGETISKLHTISKQILLQYRANYITQYYFEKAWFQNIIYNIDKVLTSKSIASLKEACTDIPAIIAGSGPSLRDDIECIKKLGSKVLIIAAGSSVQALLHHGIEPHLVVSMDGGEPNLKVFQNVDTTHIPLLFATTIHHGIAEQNHKWKLSTRLNLEEVTPYLFSKSEGEPEPSFISSGSVTGTCIQFAAFLGCKKIYLAGQDLSYPNDEYYSEGVKHITEEAKKNTIEAADEWIENVHGGKNRTSEKMLVTLRDLELLLLIYTDIEFINTSSKGAAIKHTVFRPLKDCINELLLLPERNKNWFKQLVEGIPAYSEQTVSKVGAKLRSELQELKMLNKKTSSIIKFISELEHVNPTQKDKCSKLLMKLNKQWGQVTGSGSFKSYISFALDTPLSQYMRYVPDIVNETNEYKKSKLIVEHLGKFATSISEFIPFAEKCMEEAIRRVDKIANGAEKSYA
ncbi:motility associated factor glycosyltransferase family protein [Paenibacillus apiarius]|uniref:motility associated factor glycosyltransferase family protein n=1 Tax=Paenibacillus apiarius TaxID=46240 RepID=UPI00197E69F7|nr:6-hydroxymethylpterin diphosphokinase MptE-like protein [Paenibacillus apiarius]MBN3523868.1 motility associated factor glycosyltransferase family protein [Paenibacillus apiarius]